MGWARPIPIRVFGDGPTPTLKLTGKLFKEGHPRITALFADERDDGMAAAAVPPNSSSCI